MTIQTIETHAYWADDRLYLVRGQYRSVQNLTARTWRELAAAHGVASAPKVHPSRQKRSLLAPRGAR